MVFLKNRIVYPTSVKQELPPFISSHNKGYDSDYYRCFVIDYKRYEKEYFSGKYSFYLRFRPFAVPKIRNNILKYLFGRKKYEIQTSFEGETCSYSELLSKKEARDRVEFLNGDGFDRKIYYSHKEYGGYVFKSKKEEMSKRSSLDFMCHLYGMFQNCKEVK